MDANLHSPDSFNEIRSSLNIGNFDTSKTSYGDFRNNKIELIRPKGETEDEIMIRTKINSNTGERCRHDWIDYFLGKKCSDHPYIFCYDKTSRKRYASWNTLQQESILSMLEKTTGEPLNKKQEYIFDNLGTENCNFSFAGHRITNIFEILKKDIDIGIDCIALQECEVWLVKCIYEYILQNKKPYIINYCPSSTYLYEKNDKNYDFTSSYGNCLVVKVNNFDNTSDTNIMRRDFFSYIRHLSSSREMDREKMNIIFGGSKQSVGITNVFMHLSKFCAILCNNTLYVSIHIQKKDIQYLKDDLYEFLERKICQHNYISCNKIVIMGDFNAYKYQKVIDDPHTKFINYMKYTLLSPGKNNIKLNFFLANKSDIVDGKIDHIFVYNRKPGNFFV